MSNEGINIVDAYTSLRAMSNAPYTTMSALAELIDNALQARANYIGLIAQDTETRSQSGSRVKRLKNLAVYDNGVGMNAETIENALAVGFSRNREDKNGIGKFGYGLTVGSVSQASRVDVYSWQKKGEYLHTYIDMEELRQTRSQTIPAVKLEKELPIIGRHKWDKHLTPGKSGTLVVWSELNQYKAPKTSAGVINRFAVDLSRIYRHYIDDDDEYGEKRNIEIIHLNADTTIVERKALLPNDPLYLLTPNTLPTLKGVDYSKIATNELQDTILMDVKYLDKNDKVQTSKVEIRFSMANPTVRDLGGGSLIGKHYGRNNGISFVRSGREIKLGDFGWKNPAEVRHRWLGVEVRFKPELDDYFGLSADKQNILNMRAYNDANPARDIFDEESEQDFRIEFYLAFDSILKDAISTYTTAIKQMKLGSTKQKSKSVIEKANQLLKEENEQTATKVETAGLTKAEVLEEHRTILEKTESQWTKEEILEESKKKSDWEVDIIKDSWPGTQFVDTSTTGKTFQLRINTTHKFFNNFYSYLEDEAEKDPRALEAMKLILMGYARAEDSLRAKVDPERKIFPKLNQRWGDYVDKLIDIAED